MSTPRAIKPSSRPALRLVSTKGMNREQWLKVRKQGIGASDAAAAVGLEPGVRRGRVRGGRAA